MKSKKKENKCTDYGKLMIMFATNLIICNQMIDAVKVIEEYGFKYKHDKMTYVNMLKLFSIVFLKEKSYDSSVKQIDKAILGFTKIGSASGLSLCYLIKAYLSLDNLEESSSWSHSESPNNSKENYEVKRCLGVFDECIIKSGNIGSKEAMQLRLIRDKIMAYIQNNKSMVLDENIMQGEFKKKLILAVLQPVFSLENDSPIPKLGFGMSGANLCITQSCIDKKRKTVTKELKSKESKFKPEKKHTLGHEEIDEQPIIKELLPRKSIGGQVLDKIFEEKEHITSKFK